MVVSTTPELITSSAELTSDLTTEIESSFIEENTNIESESESSSIKESNLTKSSSTIDVLFTSGLSSDIEPSPSIESKTDIEFAATDESTTIENSNSPDIYSTRELTITSTKIEPSSTDENSTVDYSTTMDVFSTSHLSTSIEYSSIEPSSETESPSTKESNVTDSFSTPELLTSVLEQTTESTTEIEESTTIGDSSSADTFTTFQISTNVESVSTKQSSEVEFLFTENSSITEDPSVTDIMNSSTHLSSIGTISEMFSIVDSSIPQIVSTTAASNIPQKSSTIADTIDDTTDTPTDNNFLSLAPSSTSVFSSSFRMSTIGPSLTPTIQSIMASSVTMGSIDSSDFVASTYNKYTVSSSKSRDFVLPPSVNGDSDAQSIFRSSPSGTGTLSPFETSEPTIVPHSSSSDDILYVLHSVAAVAIRLPERLQVAGKGL